MTWYIFENGESRLMTKEELEKRKKEEKEEEERIMRFTDAWMDAFNLRNSKVAAEKQSRANKRYAMALLELFSIEEMINELPEAKDLELVPMDMSKWKYVVPFDIRAYLPGPGASIDPLWAMDAVRRITDEDLKCKWVRRDDE